MGLKETLYAMVGVEEKEPHPVQETERSVRYPKEEDFQNRIKPPTAPRTYFTKEMLMKLVVTTPNTRDDCTSIVNSLRENIPVIVDFSKAESGEAHRCFNYLLGAVYSLNGSVRDITPLVYVFTPEKIEISKIRFTSFLFTWSQAIMSAAFIISRKENNMGDTNNEMNPGRRYTHDQIVAILDQLENGITELFESDRYKEYLSCMSKFHNYSLNNTLLIAMQRPDATLVAGFGAWKDKHGRTVKKGEKGIRILAPYKYAVKLASKDEDAEPEYVERTGFKPTFVFDISQTEGKELPSIGVSELSGDVSEYNKFFRALRIICPVPIDFEDIQDGSKGYFSDSENRIAIKKDMSQIQTIKTLIHETAHAMLHSSTADNKDNPTDRRTKEVEAESIAFTVCKRYGLDTGDYSFGYIAGWSSGKDTKELKASLERIKDTADKMITGIDKSIDKQTLLETASRNDDRER